MLACPHLCCTSVARSVGDNIYGDRRFKTKEGCGVKQMLGRHSVDYTICMLEVGIDQVLHTTAGRCLPERGLQLHGLTSGKVPALSLCCTMQRHVHSLRSVVGIDASAAKKHWRTAFGMTAVWCVITRRKSLRCEHPGMLLNQRYATVLLDNQLHFGSMRHSF